MEYRIINTHNSDVTKLNADYVFIHSGIDVGWIHSDSNVTTISLCEKHYKVNLEDDTIHIKRG